MDSSKSDDGHCARRSAARLKTWGGLALLAKELMLHDQD
jgi:hypothetical protein